MQKETNPWYASWFDTPFYHILYQDRDEKEAAFFIKNLLAHLKLEAPASILDLACGKGRHARFLNQLGYDVTGVDLSEQSINYAKQYENELLKFEVHDKLNPYPKQFDAVFNLFTSFGYFEKDEDNLKVVKNIKASIKDGGYGVIDFMNAHKAQQNLREHELKTVDGIDFKLHRYVENNCILKDIEFKFEAKDYKYTERVKAFELEDFKKYFDQAGVELIDVFGDFDLSPFNYETSNRLILIIK